jgi:hypothetical protein
MTCPGGPKQGPSGGFKMRLGKTLIIAALPLALAVGCETSNDGKAGMKNEAAMQAQSDAKRAVTAANAAVAAANAAAASAAAAARAAEAAAAEAKAAGDKADRVFRKGMRK